MREQTGSFENLCNSLERDSHSPDRNALKLGGATAHGAVLQLLIQTTLKQLCEAVELQTYKEGGTRNRAGSRQAGNQDRTASQLKTNGDKHTEHAVPTVWPI